MADFENATPFGVRLMPSADRDGRDLLLIVVAVAFFALCHLVLRGLERL